METTLLNKLSGSKNNSPNNFSNYLSGISGMIAPVTTDIKGVYDEYNQKIQTPLEQNFNVANYNELANLGPTYMDMSGYQKMSGKDIFIDSQLTGAAEGAAAGSSLGPWGALAGAVSGNAMHLWKDLAHNNVGYKDYLQQVNSFNTRQLQNYNNNILDSYDKLNYNYMKNQKVNYALGGEMLGQPTNQVTEFNTGGSHETNPYGGIPQGFGMNNMQNTVEEGEVKYNNFIFSKRVYPTKDILNKFNLPVSYFGLSIADIAKRLNKEGKERPSDPISNKGKDAMYERLQQAQEMQKISNEAAKNNMSVEEYMMAVQQQQSQQSQEQQNQFAKGGSLDGPGDPPVVADATRVQQNNLPYNHLINQQQVAEDFIKSYIAQTAYMNSSQIGDYNKTLNTKERAVVSSLPNNVVDKARQSYIDNHQGNVTIGKNISWWDDYKETAAGQNMVKFFNSPVTQELITGLTIGFGSLPTATKGATFVPKITTNPTNQVNKAIVRAATIGIPAFIGMGVNVDNERIAKEQSYDMQMKYNNLKNIEQQIVNANTRGDVKGLEQAVAIWQQTVNDYGFKDYSLQRGTPVYNVLQEQQLINLAGKPVGLFNNKIDTDTTSSTTSTTNTQGAFIPPILKNHKVTNVNGNITTFDNGVIVIKDSSGDYIIQHPTNSLGMRVESYEASNKKQSDGFFDSNNYGYIGSYDEVVNHKPKTTTSSKPQSEQVISSTPTANNIVQNRNTSNSRQSYSGNTSNYTPIDYDSEKGKSYTQKYDSIQDLDKLYQDWRTANPNSEYTSDQFQILAYDNKWGPVHQFIYDYKLPTTNNSNTTKPTTSTTNTVDLSGMNAAPGWDDLPETVVTPTTEEAQTNNWNRWKEAAMFFNPARLAPIFNDLYNLSNQEGADPTLANSIRSAYTPIQAEQFGQQMAFTPFDWRANEIAQRAKAQSAQRTMMNIAGGNTAAATANLALQNAINQGDIAANYRQGIEYNNAQMATALGFNNQLDQANAMNRQQVNQANNANYMNSLINSAQVWDQEKKLIEQTRGQNQNILAQNLSGLGQDFTNFNMINNNPALLYSMFGNYKGK